jgi:hypothetical protein
MSSATTRESFQGSVDDGPEGITKLKGDLRSRVARVSTELIIAGSALKSGTQNGDWGDWGNGDSPWMNDL